MYITHSKVSLVCALFCPLPPLDMEQPWPVGPCRSWQALLALYSAQLKGSRALLLFSAQHITIVAANMWYVALQH